MLYRRTGVALALLSLLGCGVVRSDDGGTSPTPTPAASPAAALAPEFVVSSDPAEAVIRVAIRSQQIIGSPVYTYSLYGDGRLLYEEIYRTRRPSEEGVAPTPAPPSRPGRAVRLDAVETRSLVSLAAVPALVEADEYAIAEELHRNQPDGVVVTVDIRLIRYSRGPIDVSAVERRFVAVDLTSVRHHKGDSSRALAALVRGVQETHRAKESGL